MAEPLSWQDMWLTPDQQGRLAFQHGDFAAASERFADPMWRRGTLPGRPVCRCARCLCAARHGGELLRTRGTLARRSRPSRRSCRELSQALARRPGWPAAKGQSGAGRAAGCCPEKGRPGAAPGSQRKARRSALRRQGQKGQGRRGEYRPADGRDVDAQHPDLADRPFWHAAWPWKRARPSHDPGRLALRLAGAPPLPSTAPRRRTPPARSGARPIGRPGHLPRRPADGIRGRSLGADYFHVRGAVPASFGARRGRHAGRRRPELHRDHRRHRLQRDPADLSHHTAGAGALPTAARTGDLQLCGPAGRGDAGPRHAARSELRRRRRSGRGGRPRAAGVTRWRSPRASTTIPAKLGAGDVLVRSLEATAEGLPAMLIPEPDLPAPDGIASIAATRCCRPSPRARRNHRGQAPRPGHLWFDTAGTFELPAVAIAWYDPVNKRQRVAEAPAIPVTVAAQAMPASPLPLPAPEPVPAKARHPGAWGVAAAVLAALAWAAVRLLPRLRQAAAAAAARRRGSEAAYFRRFVEACRSGTAAEYLPRLRRVGGRHGGAARRRGGGHGCRLHPISLSAWSWLRRRSQAGDGGGGAGNRRGAPALAEGGRAAAPFVGHPAAAAQSVGRRPAIAGFRPLPETATFVPRHDARQGRGTLTGTTQNCHPTVI